MTSTTSIRELLEAGYAAVGTQPGITPTRLKKLRKAIDALVDNHPDTLAQPSEVAFTPRPDTGDDTTVDINRELEVMFHESSVAVHDYVVRLFTERYRGKPAQGIPHEDQMIGLHMRVMAASLTTQAIRAGILDEDINFERMAATLAPLMDLRRETLNVEQKVTDLFSKMYSKRNTDS